MPPISRFAPYALGAAIWNYTIQLYLRENPKTQHPKMSLEMLYTCFIRVTGRLLLHLVISGIENLLTKFRFLKDAVKVSLLLTSRLRQQYKKDSQKYYRALSELLPVPSKEKETSRSFR